MSPIKSIVLLAALAVPAAGCSHQPEEGLSSSAYNALSLPGNNLCANPDFERDVDGSIASWFPMTAASGDSVDLSAEVMDKSDGSSRGLRVELLHGDGNTGSTGAIAALTSSLPAGSSVRVRFDAKALSGARLLTLQRPWGGSAAEGVELLPAWRRYEIELHLQYSTQSLLFSATDSETLNTNSGAADAEFLLDNVYVEALPNLAASGAGSWTEVDPTGNSVTVEQEDPLVARFFGDTAQLQGEAAVRLQTSLIPAGATVRIRLRGRSDTGADVCLRARAEGATNPAGSRAVIMAPGNLQYYELEFDTESESSAVLFNLCSNFSNRHPALGRIELDDVDVHVLGGALTATTGVDAFRGYVDGQRNDGTLSLAEQGHVRFDSRGLALSGGRTGLQFASLERAVRSRRTRLRARISGRVLEGPTRVRVSSVGAQAEIDLPSAAFSEQIVELCSGVGPLTFEQVTAAGDPASGAMELAVLWVGEVADRGGYCSNCGEEGEACCAASTCATPALTCYRDDPSAAKACVQQPATYSDFVAAQNTDELLELLGPNPDPTLCTSPPCDAIYLPASEYILPNPVQIDRDRPLLLHGAGRHVRLRPTDPTRPLFSVTSASRVNLSNLSLFPVKGSNAGGVLLESASSQPLDIEVQEVWTDSGTFHFAAPGRVRLQGVYFETKGKVAHAIVLDNPDLDLTMFGGNITGLHPPSNLPPGFDRSSSSHVYAGRGRLRMYGTSMQSALGSADIRIDAAPELPHVLAHLRSEGSEKDSAFPSTLVETGSGPVDLVVKGAGGNWLDDTDAKRIVHYNGTGTAWLVGNHSSSPGPDNTTALLTGDAADATIVAIGNLMGSAEEIPGSGAWANVLAVGGAHHDGATMSLYEGTETDGIDIYTPQLPTALPHDGPPAPLHRPRVVQALPGMTDLGELTIVVDGVDRSLVGHVPAASQSDAQAEANFAILQAALDAAEPGTLFLPPGEYRIKPPSASEELYYGYRHGGGWFAGAGRDQTAIVRTDDQSVLRVEAKFLTVQGITFRTGTFDGSASSTVQVPNVALEYGEGATQEVMFHDVWFDGGRHGLSLGLDTGTLCSENLLVDAKFSNARVGMAVGSFNALSNLVVDAEFVDNQYAIGHPVSGAASAGGTFAVYGARVVGSTYLTALSGTAHGVWYFSGLTSDAPWLLNRPGWNQNGRPILIENSVFSPADGSALRYRHDGVMGPTFIRSAIEASGCSAGEHCFELKFSGQRAATLTLIESAVSVDNQSPFSGGEQLGEIYVVE